MARRRVLSSNTLSGQAGAIHELPDFAREIKNIFTPDEIRFYFENLARVGPAGHVMTDEQYNVMREAGALDTNVVRGAEDVIIVARMRELMLEESPS